MARTRTGRLLVAALFTDIVSSTEIAEELGDGRWRDLLTRHHAILRREIRRFGGREIDNAGDGFFATFATPADAVRCACAASDDVRALGVEIRAGVHFGEAEQIGDKVGGLGVHLGARALSLAGAGEVLVTSSVRELSKGAGFTLEDRGVHRLKGFDEPQRLFAVTAVDGVPREPPLDGAIAAERRSDIQPGAASRRRLALVGGVVAVLLLGAGAVALAVRGDGSASPAVPPANAFAEIDPSNGDLLGVVDAPPVGVRGPTVTHPMAVAGGRVWSIRPPQLLRIDARRRRLDPSIALGTKSHYAVGIEGDSVWVLVDPELVRFDREGHALGSELIQAGGGIGAGFGGADDMAVAPSGVWLGIGDGRLVRFDPGTERSRTFDVGTGIDAVEADERAVWTGDSLHAVVTRVDPSDGSVQATVHLTGSVDALALGQGRLWVLDRSGQVTPIDASGNQVLSPIRVGPSPTDIVVGLGGVWVSDEDGSVYRIDPVTSVVTRVPVGRPMYALAVDEQARTLWVDLAPPRTH